VKLPQISIWYRELGFERRRSLDRPYEPPPPPVFAATSAPSSSSAVPYCCACVPASRSAAERRPRCAETEAPLAFRAVAPCPHAASHRSPRHQRRGQGAGSACTVREPLHALTSCRTGAAGGRLRSAVRSCAFRGIESQQERWESKGSCCLIRELFTAWFE
jgi:hypothetical protein